MYVEFKNEIASFNNIHICQCDAFCDLCKCIVFLNKGNDIFVFIAE